MTGRHLLPPPPLRRVSVVITSYDQKPYLEEAIDSVLAQTFPPHEIIVADDCSHDGSQDLIRRYMDRFPGLVKGIFQRTNQLIPSNRNSALRAATGDFVAILDGDDRLLPTNLEQQINAIFNAGGRACTYTNLYCINAQGERISTRDTTPLPSGQIFQSVAAGLFGMLRSMVMPLEVVRAAGLMDETFPHYDGFVLCLRLAKVLPVLYIAAPLAEYRVYPESVSQATPYRLRLKHLRAVYRLVRHEVNDLQLAEIQKMETSWENLFSEIETAALPDWETKQVTVQECGLVCAPLNTPLAFGSGETRRWWQRIWGFAVPEDWGIWTDGSPAIALFRVSTACDLRAEFVMHPFVPDENREITVDVSINGLLLDTWCFRGPESIEPRRQCLRIPKESINADGVIWLVFGIKNTRSPKQLGLTGLDRRALGIGLREVTLRALAE